VSIEDELKAKINNEKRMLEQKGAKVCGVE
jgi:hypothetical protein